MVSPAWICYIILDIACRIALATCPFLCSCIAVRQHPESQHVLNGRNATFSCRIRHTQSDISWEELFPNGTRKTLLIKDEGTGVDIYENETPSERSSTLTIITTPSNAQRWNGAILRCFADVGGGSLSSSSATLAIYNSLSKYTKKLIPSTPADGHNNYCHY